MFFIRWLRRVGSCFESACDTSDTFAVVRCTGWCSRDRRDVRTASPATQVSLSLTIQHGASTEPRRYTYVHVRNSRWGGWSRPSRWRTARLRCVQCAAWDSGRTAASSDVRPPPCQPPELGPAAGWCGPQFAAWKTTTKFIMKETFKLCVVWDGFSRTSGSWREPQLVLHTAEHFSLASPHAYPRTSWYPAEKQATHFTASVFREAYSACGMWGIVEYPLGLLYEVDAQLRECLLLDSCEVADALCDLQVATQLASLELVARSVVHASLQLTHLQQNQLLHELKHATNIMT